MTRTVLSAFTRILCATLFIGSSAGSAGAAGQLGIAFPTGEGLEFSARHLDTLNVRLFRFGVHWAGVEPERGAFDWGSGFDAQIKWALENNYSGLITVQSTAPPWACDPDRQNEHGCVPRNMADFRRYVVALMDHLGELRDQYSVLPIHAVQFGNEWGRGYPGSAQEYVVQTNIVYQALKSRFPSIPFVLGGLSPGHINEIAFCTGYDVVLNDAVPEYYCQRELYQTLRGRTFHVFSNAAYDAVDVHLYWKAEEWPAYVDALTEFVIPKDRGEVPVIVTEFGGPRAGSEPIDVYYQAQRMPVYLDTILSLDVEQAYYFKLVDWGETVYAFTGLIDLDRYEQQHPNPEKPSYWIFQEYAGVIPSPAPALTITSPIEGSEIPASDVRFTAAATDRIDGDLGSSVLWTSDLEGVLGTGDPLVADLPPGRHEITATVTNSRGVPAYDLITVITLNEPPVANDQSVLMAQGDSIVIDLDFADDGYPGPHSINITREPIHGTLVRLGFGRYRYTPDPTFSSEDSVRWMISDGWRNSEIATVTIGVNAAPVAHDQIVRGRRNTPVTFSLALEDDEFPEPAEVTLVRPPLHGRLDALRSGSFLYTPDPGYSGRDDFTWRARDPLELSQVATGTIGVNVPPFARDQSVRIPPNQPKLIRLNYQDDGFPEAAAVLITRQPRHGTLKKQGPTEFLYVPEAGYIGNDDFRWKARDGWEDTEIVTVEIDVTPYPVAFPDPQSGARFRE